MEMETINLGVRKFEVSKQAKVMYYTFIIITIIHFLSLFMRDVGPVGFIFQTIYIIIMGALGVYATNCMVVGKCNIYAWIVVYLYIFIAVMYVVMFVLSLWSVYVVKNIGEIAKIAPITNIVRKSRRKSRK